MDFLFQDMIHAPFWVAVLQIIGVNIILSGDNAVVIALACMTLPPRQRLWGMILGAGAAVLLRVVFTLVVAQAMTYPYLKLVGGLLLLWVAIKLVVEDSEGEDEIEAAHNLWRAVRIVVIADIVMSLDNVIAIAASAEIAAATVDISHATAVKVTLIIFGLATSVPLIIAGSAVLLSLLKRFRILVWAGGALLGWVAGDIMSTDPALPGYLGGDTMQYLHAWAGRFGALLVLGIGLWIVRRERPIVLDEYLACVALVFWIISDIVLQAIFQGAPEHLWKVWAARAGVLFVLIVGYVLAHHWYASTARAEAQGQT